MRDRDDDWDFRDLRLELRTHKRKIMLTRRISQEVDLRLLFLIVSFLKAREEELDENTDYLQIFNLINGELHFSQEVPEVSQTIKLPSHIPYDSKNPKIYAIMEDTPEDNRYWVILFPDEY